MFNNLKLPLWNMKYINALRSVQLTNAEDQNARQSMINHIAITTVQYMNDQLSKKQISKIRKLQEKFLRTGNQ